MTASLAKEVAVDGITVNPVSPGAILSVTLEQCFRDVALERGLANANVPWKEVERAVLPLFAQVPVGRVGQLDYVAAAVAFLACPLASYITGSNLRVDDRVSPVM